jgi:putative ubiquitin-RnfH superfamily antitoxin RatB of RatAB toxin-antitoxin module
MADGCQPTIEVEIVYALPDEQFTQTLRVPAGATVGQAIKQSGLVVRYPEISPACAVVGIFGRRAEASSVLHEFDRIEIYRPLIADPKQSRRARAGRSAKSPR